MDCRTSARSPEVTCSPEATTASYSRQSYCADTALPFCLAALKPHASSTRDTSWLVWPAMAGQTNQLVSLVEEAWGFKAAKQNGRAVSAQYDCREYDAVVASGEQVTSGLLALVLQSMGVAARSWQGWQIPLYTDDAHRSARITGVAVDELRMRMTAGEVAVIAGFQGIAPGNRISTLGRGGSDTSAVALAAALSADRCDVYTDVDGVYTTDPRVVPKAHRLDRISYEEMLEMASQGAKVLQTRSVELAMQKGVRVLVRSSFDSPDLGGRGKDCLLYTSDAADDLLCVDLGGRRIIKKKK